MNTDRIKEIQSKTAYPDSRSVQQALLKVWNECGQEVRKPQLKISHDNEAYIPVSIPYNQGLRDMEGYYLTLLTESLDVLRMCDGNVTRGDCQEAIDAVLSKKRQGRKYYETT